MNFASLEGQLQTAFYVQYAVFKEHYAQPWVVKNQEGSHLHLVHPTKKGKITVPMHKGDLSIGTLNAILKHAGLK